MEKASVVVNKDKNTKNLTYHTLACLSSNSASSIRFFLKAATRRVLKLLSSVGEIIWDSLKLCFCFSLFYCYRYSHYHHLLLFLLLLLLLLIITINYR